jgi:hypothetical protein
MNEDLLPSQLASAAGKAAALGMPQATQITGNPAILVYGVSGIYTG